MNSAQFALLRGLKNFLILGVIILVVSGIFLWRQHSTTSFEPPTRPTGSPKSVSPLHVSGKWTLADLQRIVSTHPRPEAVAQLRAFLESGVDAATGLEFRLSQGGSLAQAPTLRTYALDRLQELDPPTGAAYAQTILQNKSTADEWAISLRALALGDSSQKGRKLLSDKIRAMIQFEDWRRNPTTGYLEAFDVFVYTHDIDAIIELSGFIRDRTQTALGHAAFLAVDRLIQANGAAALGVLLKEPALLEGREQTRAGFFARADVRDPLQRKIVIEYLLAPDRSKSELDVFAELFPNANYMVSKNLLTPAVTPTPAEMRARDAATLRMVGEWIGQKQFEQIKPQLSLIRTRLQKFVPAKSG